MAGTPIEILIKAMGAEEVVTALKKVTAEGANVKKSLTETGTSLDTLGSKSKGALGNIPTEFNKASVSTTQFSGALKNTNPALNDFSTNFQNAAKGAPQLTTALDQTATKTQTLTEKGRGLSTSFQSTMASTVALTGTAIALFETWDSVSDSELAVEKARTALGRSTVALSTYERLYAAEVAKNGVNSLKAIEYQDRIAVQREDIKNKTGDLANAEENLAIIQTHFYKEIIPLTMAAGASMFQMFTNGRGALTAMGGAFKGLIPAISATNVSLRGLALNPILLPLTAISAVLVLFTTNMFGVRDAINAAGKAIGDMLPFLRPFLDMLGSFGKVLTDTFGGGISEAQALEGELSSSMEGSTASVQGFGDKATTALDGVSTATGGLATATQEATAKAAQYLANLTKRYQETKTQLENTFSRTVPLGPGTSVSGISGISNLDTQKEPASEFLISEYGKRGEGGINKFQQQVDSVNGLKEAMRALTDVTVFYDETEKILYYDQNQLNAAVEKGTITTEQYSQIQALMGEHFKAAAISGQANVGMYDQLGDTLNVLTGASKPLVDITAAQTIATTQHTTAMKKLDEEFNTNWAILNSVTSAQDLYDQGSKKLQVDLQKANIELRTSTGYWESYRQVLETTQGQQNEFNQGVVKQRQALVESKVNVLQTAGAYSELVKQMQTGQPQTIAYTQAVFDQKIALEQSKIEVFALQGTLDELTRQYQSGEQSILAFNVGFLTQQRALIDTALAVDTTRGTIAALEGQLASGSIQLIAWNKGLEEGRLAILQNTVALEEREGVFQAQLEALADGTLQEQAYAEATLEMKENLVASITEVIKLEAALAEYNNQLKIGVPQSVAMNKAFLEGEKAVAGLQEQLAASIGEYKSLVAHINDASKNQTIMNQGFIEGTNNGLKWVDTLVKANSEQVGYKKGLLELADNWKIKIPEALYASSEAMEEFIALQLRMPDAIDRGLKKAMEDGKAAIDGLTEAWDKGNNISENEIEKLLDMHIPDDYRKELNLSFEFQVNEKKITDDVNNMLALFAFDPPDTKATADKMVNNLKKDLDSQFQKGAISKTFHDQMMTALNSMPDPQNVPAFSAWIGQFKLLQQAIADGDVAKVGQIVAQITSGTDAINASAAAYKELSGAINSTVAAYTNLKPDEGTLKDSISGGVGVGVGAQTGATADPRAVPTPGPDTSAIDAAQVKLDSFKTALSGLPAFITGVITQANASFTPLGDPFLNEIPAKILNFSTTIQSMPQFIMESVVVPVNESLTSLGDPFLNEIPAKILSFSQTLAQLPGFVASSVVSPIIQNFTGMANALQSGPFTKIQTDAAVAFQAVTNIARAEAAKLATIFDSAIQQAISKFNQLQSSVASVMSSIVSSTNSARSSVESLADSINSLQDRTVTITTRYETIGSPASAATGFGPTIVDHPTRLLVGESGPEYVQVTPLASSSAKNLSPDKRLDMFADPGKKRMNTAPLFELAHGTSMNGIAGLPGTNGTGNSIFTPGQNGLNGTNGSNNINLDSNTLNSVPNNNGVIDGPEDWVSVNIVAVGGRNVSSTGNALPIWGSTGGAGGSSGGGGGSSGGGGGGSSSGGGGSNNNFNYQGAGGKFYRYNNGQIDTNMTESEIAMAEASLGYKFPRNSDSPTVPGSGGGGTGSGTVGTSYTVPSGVRNAAQAAANAQETGVPLTPEWTNVNTSNPDDWRAVPMTQDPNTNNFPGWKVVTGDGKNIAVRFNSKAEAEQYIREHQLAKRQGSYTSPTQGGGTLNVPPASGGGGNGGGGGGQTITDEGIFQDGQTVLFNGSVIQNGRTIGGNSSGGSSSGSVTSGGSIIGQGNNSNIQYQGPSGKYYSNQNGVVNTNMTPQEIASLGLGGIFGGGGGLPGISNPIANTGSILEPLRGRYRSGQDNQLALFDNGAATPLTDIGITPCMLDGIGGGPGGPGGNGGNTGGIGLLTDVMQMMLNMLKNFNMPFNINTFLDGETVYRNQVKRYSGNLATFMN